MRRRGPAPPHPRPPPPAVPRRHPRPTSLHTCTTVALRPDNVQDVGAWPPPPRRRRKLSHHHGGAGAQECAGPGDGLGRRSGYLATGLGRGRPLGLTKVEERGRGKIDILSPFSLLTSHKLIFYWTKCPPANLLRTKVSSNKSLHFACPSAKRGHFQCPRAKFPQWLIRMLQAHVLNVSSVFSDVYYKCVYLGVAYVFTYMMQVFY
jgi:hypothetical protein